MDIFTEEKISVNHRKLLIEWSKRYAIRGIILHNSDILLIRNESISTLLSINRYQYMTEMNIVPLLERNYETRNDQKSNLSLDSS